MQRRSNVSSSTKFVIYIVVRNAVCSKEAMLHFKGVLSDANILAKSVIQQTHTTQLTINMIQQAIAMYVYAKLQSLPCSLVCLYKDSHDTKQKAMSQSTLSIRKFL